jgi:two-component system, OmpR family, sensor kinase
MSRERELEALVAELREAVQARDTFLTIAAHELRNPMHALLLQLEAALKVARRSADEDLLRRLERVRLTLDRYVERATALLDVSRLTAGRLQLRPAPTDLSAVVRGVVLSYDAEAAFVGATVETDMPDTMQGRWDRLAVEQIVSNLVSNAIKYGGGSPVSVSLRRDGDDVLLSVRDKGAGISPEDQQRIFERFEQAVTRAPRGGFGVGLWLVRWLAQAHGGSISVESRPGEGSLFTIRLPLDANPFQPQGK